MANPTDSLAAVSQELYDYLDYGKGVLGIQRVWYDIDDMVPTTPAILVEPGDKSREISNTGHMVINTFQVNVILLHSRMASKSETNDEALTLAEEVESYLHDNKTLNGLIIHGYVSKLEQGSVAQQKVLLRATRLLWQGMSKTRI